MIKFPPDPWGIARPKFVGSLFLAGVMQDANPIPFTPHSPGNLLISLS